MNSQHQLTIIGRLRAKPGKETELRNALLQVLKESRKETGCINYDLHISKSDSALFVLYENWTSQLALDEHFQMPHSKELAAQLPNLLTEPLMMEHLIEISDYQPRKLL